MGAKVIEMRANLRGVGRIKVRPGHQLFKYKDRAITAVEEGEYTISADGSQSIEVDEEARYTTALNLRNALKRLLRAGVIKYTE